MILISGLKKISALFLIVGAIVFTSCNDNATATATKDTLAKTNSATVATWSQEDEMEVMNACVDKLKGQLGNEKAYAHCKCILEQVKTKYPMDSTIITRLSDTAEVAKMAGNCK